MPKTRMLFAVAVSTVLITSACAETETSTVAPGPETSTAASAPAPVVTTETRDACTVLALEEITAATGISTPGAPSTSGGASVCTWMSDTGKGTVLQVYSSASDYDSSRSAFESLYGGSAEDVSGVGDAAFYIGGETGPIPTATVSARKASSAISVQVMGMGEEPTRLRQQAIDLARVAIGKV